MQREEVEGITLLTGEATKRRSNTSDNRRKRRTLRVTLFFRLLAIIGVIITILVSSDFMKNLRAYIFNPFIDYWTGNCDLAFSWSRFNVFFLLLISAIMLIMSCHYLFKTINANIDYQKIRNDNPELVNESYIFFGSITKMTYEDFKKNEVNYLEDLKSQIYVNSMIASNKFLNYNKSLYWFKFLLWVSILLFISIMIMR